MSDSSDDNVKKKKIKTNAEIPEHFTESKAASVQNNSTYITNDQTFCSVCKQWFSGNSYYSHSCLK
ncbi:MAG: hypothetical protein E6K94_10205 [Thaumarchaeota archaeon]|nr:MAG: hypothetical protein E6K94_10205 [Nitrososphaerota archaeon]